MQEPLVQVDSIGYSLEIGDLEPGSEHQFRVRGFADERYSRWSRPSIRVQLPKVNALQAPKAEPISESVIRVEWSRPRTIATTIERYELSIAMIKPAFSKADIGKTVTISGDGGCLVDERPRHTVWGSTRVDVAGGLEGILDEIDERIGKPVILQGGRKFYNPCSAVLEQHWSKPRVVIDSLGPLYRVPSRGQDDLSQALAASRGSMPAISQCEIDGIGLDGKSLIPGAAYKIRVRAEADRYGETAWSPPCAVVMPKIMPPQPPVCIATSRTSIYLWWSAPDVALVHDSIREGLPVEGNVAEASSVKEEPGVARALLFDQGSGALPIGALSPAPSLAPSSTLVPVAADGDEAFVLDAGVSPISDQGSDALPDGAPAPAPAVAPSPTLAPIAADGDEALVLDARAAAVSPPPSPPSSASNTSPTCNISRCQLEVWHKKWRQVQLDDETSMSAHFKDYIPLADDDGHSMLPLQPGHKYKFRVFFFSDTFGTPIKSSKSKTDAIRWWAMETQSRVEGYKQRLASHAALATHMHKPSALKERILEEIASLGPKPNDPNVQLPLLLVPGKPQPHAVPEDPSCLYTGVQLRWPLDASVGWSAQCFLVHVALASDDSEDDTFEWLEIGHESLTRLGKQQVLQPHCAHACARTLARTLARAHAPRP